MRRADCLLGLNTPVHSETAETMLKIQAEVFSHIESNHGEVHQEFLLDI